MYWCREPNPGPADPQLCTIPTAPSRLKLVVCAESVFRYVKYDVDIPSPIQCKNSCKNFLKSFYHHVTPLHPVPTPPCYMWHNFWTAPSFRITDSKFKRYLDTSGGHGVPRIHFTMICSWLWLASRKKNVILLVDAGWSGHRQLCVFFSRIKCLSMSTYLGISPHSDVLNSFNIHTLNTEEWLIRQLFWYFLNTT